MWKIGPVLAAAHRLPTSPWYLFDHAAMERYSALVYEDQEAFRR